MILKALEIQQATQEAIMSDEVMDTARVIAIELCDGDSAKLNRIAELMFKYTATLAAMTATTVAYACLGDSTMSEIADEIREYDELTQQIEKEMK
jgi:hypothetical protein